VSKTIDCKSIYSEYDDKRIELEIDKIDRKRIAQRITKRKSGFVDKLKRIIRGKS